MRKIKIILILLLGLALFLIAQKSSFFLTPEQIIKNHPRDEVALSPFEIEVLRKDLERKIEKEGLEKTNVYLREKYSKIGSSINHLIQHFFGEMVYAQKGIEGITICGFEHPNGCLHGLITKAFETEGYPNAIEKVVAICRESKEVNYTCVHILGHWFEIASGEAAIDKALEACDGLNIDVAPSACYSGVFMQYYLPGIYEGVGEIIRKFDEQNAFTTCQGLKNSVYRQSCTLYTVEWWQFALNKDYEKMAELCRGLGREDRDHCYESLGALSADNYLGNEGEVKRVCNLLNSNDRLKCFAGAIKFLVSNGGAEEKKAAETFCPDSIQSCAVASRRVFY